MRINQRKKATLTMTVAIAICFFIVIPIVMFHVELPIVREAPSGGTAFAYSETYVVGENVYEGGTTGVLGAQTADGIYENVFENNYQSITYDNTYALAVYYDNTSTPKYRIWNGTSWGAQGNCTAVSGRVRWVVLKYARTRDEAILGTLDNKGDIRVQFWNGTTSTWGATKLIANVGTTYAVYRRFDIEYENGSGNAVIVFAENNTAAQLKYSVWNGSTWTVDNVLIDLVYKATGIIYWVEMAANPTADNNEIALIYSTNFPTVFGFHWSGTAWDNMGATAAWSLAAGPNATKKWIDVTYESQSGSIMFMWASGTATDQYWRIYENTPRVLSAVTLLDISTEATAVNWIKLVSDPRTDNILYAAQTLTLVELEVCEWSGTKWGTSSELDTLEDTLDMNFGMTYETFPVDNVGHAWIMYGDALTVSMQHKTGSTWAAAVVVPGSDDTARIFMIAHPVSGVVFSIMARDSTAASGGVLENENTGSVWGGTSFWVGTMTANPIFEGFSIAPKVMTIRTNYRENVQHNITGIPFADDYLLRIEYYINGDNENVSVYIYNFSTLGWDNIGNLTSRVLDNFTYAITANYISADEVRIRYVQPNGDSTQTSLMIDFARVEGTLIERLWRLVETWNGTINAPVSWRQVESWSGTVNSSTLMWQQVETWVGTLKTVYLITNVYELQGMEDDLSGDYILVNDIDASVTHTWDENGTGGYRGFEPIGEQFDEFAGSFDGRRYKISNLYINRPSTNEIGLFGRVGSEGVVENAGLENVNIYGGINYAGGLVGVNDGTMSNCFSTGTVSGSGSGYGAVGGLAGINNNGTITNSYSTGSVSGTRYVGGLVGAIGWGLVDNCYSTGSVSGKDAVGGLAGINATSAYLGLISNSFSDSIVEGENRVGGLLGYNDEGTVSNSYSSGAVIGTNEVGGLIGNNYGNLTLYTGIVLNSYSTGTVDGSAKVGGLVGYNDHGTMSNSYSTGNVNGDTDVGGLVGYSYYGTVSNSFWDNETSGTKISAGGTWKTTENMKDVRTFTDNIWSENLTTPWDFVGNPYHDVENENIWNIHFAVNNSYPFLTNLLPIPQVWYPIETWTGTVSVYKEWRLVTAWTEAYYYAGAEPAVLIDDLEQIGTIAGGSIADIRTQNGIYENIAEQNLFPSGTYTYVSSYGSVKGTVVDFLNEQDNDDAGAYATLTESPSSVFAQTENTWINLAETFGYGAGVSAVYVEYNGAKYIYQLKGGSDNFYRYCIDNDTWERMATTPASVGTGGALVYVDATLGGKTKYLFAFQGGNTTGFWYYRIEDDTWIPTISQAPESVSGGGALVWTGGDNIYATKGGFSSFWRYFIYTDTWDNTGLPAFWAAGSGAGNAFAFDNVNKRIYAWRGGLVSFRYWEIGAASWTVRASLPSGINPGAGGSLAWAGPENADRIYAARGGGTVSNLYDNFWYFSISGNSWALYDTLAHFPEWVGSNTGNRLVYKDNFLYYVRGTTSSAFWRYATVNTGYAMEIDELIDAIPLSDDYTLQMRYELANAIDTFRVQVWDGSTWENRGATLSSVSWENWSYTLLDDEITYGEVDVKFIDVNPISTSQDGLLIDYLRVNGTGTPHYALRWEHQIENVTTGFDNYVLKISGYTSGDSENVVVAIWDNADTMWENIGTLTTTEGTITRVITGEQLSDYRRGENIYIKYESWDNTDTTPTTIHIDLAYVACVMTVNTTVQWRLVETWDGTVNATTGIWRQVELWVGTVTTPIKQWRQIETWIGTIAAPPWSSIWGPHSESYGVALVGAHDNIYLVTSNNNGVAMFYVYMVTNDTWDELSSPNTLSGIQIKCGAYMVWDNSNFIYSLVGGATADAGSDNKAKHGFIRYDIANDNWTQLQGTNNTMDNSVSVGEEGAGDALTWVPGSVLGVSDDNFIYAITGGHQPITTKNNSHFMRYSIKDDYWTLLDDDYPWVATESSSGGTDDGASLIWTGGNYLYALRGEYHETSADYDFAKYKITTDTWNTSILTPETLWSPGGTGDGGGLIWIGGDMIYAMSGGTFDEVERKLFSIYFISGDRWIAGPELPYGVTDTNGHRLARDSGRTIYVWRGYVNGTEPDNVLMRYTPPLPPGQPILFSPIDFMLTPDSTPNFVWTSGENSENSCLQIDDDDDFSTLTIDENLTYPIDNYTPVSAMSWSSYYWRVLGVSSTGESVSDTWRFAVWPTTAVGGPKLPRVIMGFETIRVYGSIYASGENAQTWVQILDNLGQPVNTATVKLTVYYENLSKLFNDVTMNYVSGSPGIYYYDFIAPTLPATKENETFMCSVIATWNGVTAYGSGEFQVKRFISDITNIRDNIVWVVNYLQNTLLPAITQARDNAVLARDNAYNTYNYLVNMILPIVTQTRDNAVLARDNAYNTYVYLTTTVKTELDNVYNNAIYLRSQADNIKTEADNLQTGMNISISSITSTYNNTAMILENVRHCYDNANTIYNYLVNTLYNYLQNTIYAYLVTMNNKLDNIQLGINEIKSVTDNIQIGANEIKAAIGNIQAGINSISSKCDNIQIGVNNIKGVSDNIQIGLNVLRVVADNIQVSVNTLITKCDNVQVGVNVIKAELDQVRDNAQYIRSQADNIKTLLDNVQVGVNVSIADIVLAYNNTTTIVSNCNIIIGRCNFIENYLENTIYSYLVNIIYSAIIQTKENAVLARDNAYAAYNYLVNTILPIVTQTRDNTALARDNAYNTYVYLTGTVKVELDNIYNNAIYLKSQADNIKTEADNLQAGINISISSITLTYNNTVSILENVLHCYDNANTIYNYLVNTIYNYLSNTIYSYLVTMKAELDNVQLGINGIKGVADNIQIGANAIRVIADSIQLGINSITSKCDNIQVGVNAIKFVSDNVQTGINAIRIVADNIQSGTNSITSKCDNMQIGVNSIKEISDDILVGVNALKVVADNIQIGANNIKIVVDNLQVGANLIKIELDQVRDNALYIRSQADNIENVLDNVQLGVNVSIADITLAYNNTTTIIASCNAIIAQCNVTENYLENIIYAYLVTQFSVVDSKLDNVQIGANNIKGVSDNIQMGLNLLRSAVDNVQLGVNVSASDILTTYNYLVTTKVELDQVRDNALYIRSQADNIKAVVDFLAASAFSDNMRDNILAIYANTGMIIINTQVIIDNCYYIENYLENTIYSYMVNIMTSMITQARDNSYNTYVYLMGTIKNELDDMKDNIGKTLDNAVANYIYLISTVQNAIDEAHDNLIYLKSQADNIKALVDNWGVTVFPENMSDNVLAIYANTNMIIAIAENIIDNCNTIYAYLTTSIMAKLNIIETEASRISAIVVPSTWVKDSENCTIYAQVLDDEGNPATSAVVKLCIWNWDMSLWLDYGDMVSLSRGIYQYRITAPAIIGTYGLDIYSTNPIAYGHGVLQVVDPPVGLQGPPGIAGTSGISADIAKILLVWGGLLMTSFVYVGAITGEAKRRAAGILSKVVIPLVTGLLVIYGYCLKLIASPAILAAGAWTALFAIGYLYFVSLVEPARTKNTKNFFKYVVPLLLLLTVFYLHLNGINVWAIW